MTDQNIAFETNSYLIQPNDHSEIQLNLYFLQSELFKYFLVSELYFHCKDVHLFIPLMTKY